MHTTELHVPDPPSTKSVIGIALTRSLDLVVTVNVPAASSFTKTWQRMLCTSTWSSKAYA